MIVSGSSSTVTVSLPYIACIPSTIEYSVTNVPVLVGRNTIFISALYVRSSGVVISLPFLYLNEPQLPLSVYMIIADDGPRMEPKRSNARASISFDT